MSFYHPFMEMQTIDCIYMLYLFWRYSNLIDIYMLCLCLKLSCSSDKPLEMNK